jgi:nitrogen fixation/metabolism regulation signal transduction histidine kinase
LNLPYDFAGNSNLQSQDVAEFLGTLFNVYVIFLMLAALVAFALAKSVTRPLSIIGDKLRKIQVGGKNEKIDWKSRDEDITEFINRFNLMIEQLEASSRELARTQRESAWREMAKQVAHEIKNPLTPMKLQIQMLERASDKDPEMARDMIKKISKSLIGQIDILSNIASEFSSFAKLPAPKNEVFVLNRLLEDVCNLYTSEENMQLDLILPEEELSVFADPEQITRVLNNLIKNAIQSIPDNQSGKIDISLYKSTSFAVIQVSDNGVGIPEDRKDSIFSPYFTTKSSGTGIGLTMSKGIIESAKGQMYFTSEEAKGSIFYVELPLEGK